MNKYFNILLFGLLILNVSCEKEEDCDCQEDGIQFFQFVTSEDVDILANVEGIDLNECIRYNLENIFSDQIDYETVKIVDGCCCE